MVSPIALDDWSGFSSEPESLSYSDNGSNHSSSPIASPTTMTFGNDFPIPSVEGLGDMFDGDCAPWAENFMKDEDLFKTPFDFSTAPLDCLYSTPLSWDVPSEPTPNLQAMDAAEEARLLEIAMPGVKFEKAPQSPAESTSSVESQSTSSPRRKRKSVTDDDGSFSPQPAPKRRTSSQPTVSRSSHNMIEKKYRTNLNEKIILLRDSVPCLKAIVDNQDPDTPASTKLNKGSILSKAAEYIQSLQKRNESLIAETSNLQARVEAFQKLASSRSLST